MNYEELYAQLQPMEKKMKDMLGTAQKLQKAIAKDTENGDLKDMGKMLAAFSELLESQRVLTDSLKEAVDGFDARAYLESGDFAGQMLKLCEEKGIDVTGEYPVYEMFPYKVKFDTENQDIYLDKKRLQCLRPASLVQTVKAGQDKLTKANFNVMVFLNELTEAYDMALLKMKKKAGYDLYLTSLYKFLVPMGRSRKEYDLQSFAFDLARLYRLYVEGMEETKSGRRFQFGPCRNQAKSIRILDNMGREQFLSTICFYHKSSAAE